MAGLKGTGIDANPFGSKFQANEGGWDAGNGKRTYTRPSYTLFVTGIPDAEGSDAVEKIFMNDAGYIQCRPVGHKKARRMIFVDYATIEQATKGLQAHQGHKWEPVDSGLKIDYDQDARTKRNIAVEEGNYEKFWPLAPRREQQEDEESMFDRLRMEEEEFLIASRRRDTVRALGKGKAKAKANAKGGFRAKLQITREGASLDASEALRANNDSAAAADSLEGVGALTGYASDSDDDEDGAESVEEEEEEETEEEEEELPDRTAPSKKPRIVQLLVEAATLAGP